MNRLRRARAPAAGLCLLWGALFACSGFKPDPLRYGQEPCAYCRMTIVERKFGAELITTRGKKLKFDSIECLAAYVGTNQIEPALVHSLWFIDFASADTLIPSEAAHFVQTDRIGSPMGMGLMAFASARSADSFAHAEAGQALRWSEVLVRVRAAWHDRENP